MLKSVIISQRDNYVARVERIETAMAKLQRECPRKAGYRKLLALYRDMIAVIDRHDNSMVVAGA